MLSYCLWQWFNKPHRCGSTELLLVLQWQLRQLSRVSNTIIIRFLFDLHSKLNHLHAFHWLLFTSLWCLQGLILWLKLCKMWWRWGIKRKKQWNSGWSVSVHKSSHPTSLLHHITTHPCPFMAFSSRKGRNGKHKVIQLLESLCIYGYMELPASSWEEKKNH